MINYNCMCNSSYNNNIQGLPTNGYIDLLNYGGFFAYFSASYMIGLTRYRVESDTLAIGQETRVIIPQNATNIKVIVKVEVLVAIWMSVFEKFYLKSDEICLLTYGLSFAPFCKEIPCTGPGITGY